MQNLDLNMNIAVARTILGMVSGATSVDHSLLLDDDQFGALLHKYAHALDVNAGVAALTEYVNANY